MIAWNLIFGLCNVEGCERPVAAHCGCSRCDRESVDGAFFTCEAHARDLRNDNHERIYGRPAQWFTGDAVVRALYLGRS